MSVPRPGVDAGKNLIALDDVATWEKVERHTEHVLDAIPQLPERASYLDRLRHQDVFSKRDLDQVVEWKHTIGKNRIHNLKYLSTNDDATVKKHSQRAIAMAREIELSECLEDDHSLSSSGRQKIQQAMTELTNLKGVGPATASAMLTLIRPDVFCFMYDEVIDVFEPRRDYKISHYMRVNSRCLQLAQKLGWTSSRVARTIWTAARFLAIHGKDLTRDEQDKQDRKRPAVEKKGGKKKRAK